VSKALLPAPLILRHASQDQHLIGYIRATTRQTVPIAISEKSSKAHQLTNPRLRASSISAHAGIFASSREPDAAIMRLPVGGQQGDVHNWEVEFPILGAAGLRGVGFYGRGKTSSPEGELLPEITSAEETCRWAVPTASPWASDGSRPSGRLRSSLRFEVGYADRRPIDDPYLSNSPSGNSSSQRPLARQRLALDRRAHPLGCAGSKTEKEQDARYFAFAFTGPSRPHRVAQKHEDRVRGRAAAPSRRVEDGESSAQRMQPNSPEAAPTSTKKAPRSETMKADYDKRPRLLFRDAKRQKQEQAAESLRRRADPPPARAENFTGKDAGGDVKRSPSGCLQVVAEVSDKENFTSCSQSPQLLTPPPRPTLSPTKWSAGTTSGSAPDRRPPPTQAEDAAGRKGGCGRRKRKLRVGTAPTPASLQSSRAAIGRRCGEEDRGAREVSGWRRWRRGVPRRSPSMPIRDTARNLLAKPRGRGD